ncbi:hypothetical protein [Glaciimonas sp. PCH181]|uniref:hypothetical protein n=1 Tax=Glaciimonas sp. PCH181 TaxID=2133943 RepID=UPI000D34FD1C|nr:hypothetical protein [Glaciimonas sp. PCH181]PUA18466.1 hypothetical protein C7W93_00405 [Glaciimonas sp. PCH181]
MTAPEPYLFGNQQLHHGLGTLTRILGGLAADAPHAVRINRIREYCDYSRVGFGTAWASLVKSNLVRRDEQQPDHWRLAHDLGAITLEDLVHCVFAQSRKDDDETLAEISTSERLSKDVDIFLSQATIEINQQAFKYLRCTSLERLKRRTQVLHSFAAPMCWNKKI